MRTLVIAPFVVTLVACSVGEAGSGTPGLSFTSGGSGPDSGSTTGSEGTGSSSGADAGSSGGDGSGGDGSTGGTGTVGGSTSGASGGTTASSTSSSGGAGTSTSSTTGGASTASGGTTGVGTTGAGPDEDPGYPKPDGSMCPAGFVLLHVLDGGSLCTLECPNDGATTCPAGLTGNADPWCSFPSEVASNEDCTMSGTCTDASETCVDFASVSLCRDEKSRCGLWCGANEKTCPDGMTCEGDFCGY